MAMNNIANKLILLLLWESIVYGSLARATESCDKEYDLRRVTGMPIYSVAVFDEQLTIGGSNGKWWRGSNRDATFAAKERSFVSEPIDCFKKEIETKLQAASQTSLIHWF
jgi:hypothetical protein